MTIIYKKCCHSNRVCIELELVGSVRLRAMRVSRFDLFVTMPALLGSDLLLAAICSTGGFQHIAALWSSHFSPATASVDMLGLAVLRLVGFSWCWSVLATAPLPPQAAPKSPEVQENPISSRPSETKMNPSGLRNCDVCGNRLIKQTVLKNATDLAVCLTVCHCHGFSLLSSGTAVTSHRATAVI